MSDHADIIDFFTYSPHALVMEIRQMNLFSIKLDVSLCTTKEKKNFNILKIQLHAAKLKSSMILKEPFRPLTRAKTI